jgi:hypothetical protein
LDSGEFYHSTFCTFVSASSHLLVRMFCLIHRSVYDIWTLFHEILAFTASSRSVPMESVIEVAIQKVCQNFNMWIGFLDKGVGSRGWVRRRSALPGLVSVFVRIGGDFLFPFLRFLVSLLVVITLLYLFYCWWFSRSRLWIIRKIPFFIFKAQFSSARSLFFSPHAICIH